LGLAVLRRFLKVRLTLGACTAFRRGDLDAVGGFETFCRDLAEDNRVGWALTNAGRTVRLSHQIVTLASDPMSWRDYWRHQRRVAVTYQVSNPAGFAASIFTHGLSLAVIAAIILGFAFPISAALLVGTVWFMRWITARRTAEIVRFVIPNLFAAVLLASLVETACWVVAWCSRRVWWGGERWDVSRGGKLSS